MAIDPVNQGYVLSATTPPVSEAAPIIRLAAIKATVGSHELPTGARAIDQKGLPCCVSCALTAAMETMNSGCAELSPLFHYYVTRHDNTGANADGYLYLDSGLETLTAEGVCRRDLHSPPFTAAGAATRPSAEAYADAVTRALGRKGLRARYRSVDAPSRASAIRDELRQNHPVVIGIQLPMGYPLSFLNPTFEWLDPESSPRSLSGHCLLVTGYNDGRSAIHVQDSHGNMFDRGRWWMGYRVVDSSVVQEAYSLT